MAIFLIVTGCTLVVKWILCTFMSSTVSTATPAIPTSPGTLGLSES